MMKPFFVNLKVLLSIRQRGVLKLLRLQFRSSVWLGPIAKKTVSYFLLASVKGDVKKIVVSRAFESLFSDLCCCLCRGFIALENKTFIIEPVSSHDSDAHFIYRVEKLRLTQGDCGHGFNMSSITSENYIKSPFQSFHTRVRLALSVFCQQAYASLSLWASHFRATLSSVVVFFVLWFPKRFTGWAFDQISANWQAHHVG